MSNTTLGSNQSDPPAQEHRLSKPDESLLQMTESEIDRYLDERTEMCRRMQKTERETGKREREDQALYDAGFEAGLEEGLERAKKKLAAVKDEMAEQEQVLVTFQKTESKMKSEIETMKVQLENMKKQEDLKIEAALRKGKKEGAASMRKCYATVAAAAQRAIPSNLFS